MKALVVFAVLFAISLSSCPDKPNNQILINERPILLGEVPNGQKFIIGDLKDPLRNYVYVANLKGTAFQMGKAFGLLFKDQLKDLLSIFYKYYENQLVELLVHAKIPKFVANSVGNGALSLLKRILDLNCMITQRYTNKRYLQEMKGIATGAGLHWKEIARVNIFPQLIKAACTVAGVWGKATQHGQTLHLRSLDWDSNIPISKFPLITVYHPSTSKENIHANMGWVGLIGSLTGVSPYLSIGEKVWYPPTGSVKTTRYGNPWTYVLRDILYDAVDLKTALAILSQTHRTCAIHLGLGSAVDHSFLMFEYAQRTLNAYDDKNYTHYNATSHPKRQGIAYFDKAVQPSSNPCVGQILTDPLYYGSWQMEPLWRRVGNMHQTGDTQMVVFNLQSKQALISYSEYNGTTKAFARSPIYVNLGYFYNQF